MKFKLSLICSVLFLGSLSAQVYDDYIGLGQDTDVRFMSSDPNSTPENTLNASGYDLDIQGASRFLAYATLGPTIEEIENLSQVNIETWIDNQMEIEQSIYTIPTIEIIFELYENCLELYGTDCQFIPNAAHFRYAWWNHTMRSPDRLRQRVALALSEILVLSDMSELELFPHGIAYYYDILSTHAFGNYKDLLLDVSLNPSMGFYLSHINNPKTDEALNIHPDENYAREIMQLFTIGLYELNNDGSRKTDPNTGLWIPTYDNDDIKGLAAVFTGLSGGEWADDQIQRPVEFGRPFQRYSLLHQMQMFEAWHEQGPKTIVGNYTIPGGLTGMEDIYLAVDHLFNHPNVGPFISLRLIQQLIKSNPTPEYIDRVASVFNNNGQGVRGDMAAVVKAILLDDEAMECYWFDDIENGKLRPPILRYSQLQIALKAETQSEEYWNSGFIYQQSTGQHPMSSPTVFNFYAPDYVPDSEFAYYDMVGPEFQILNSSTSSNYVNYWLITLMRNYFNDNFGTDFPNFLNEPFFNTYVEDPDLYAAELSDPLWLELGFEPEQLVDYLDIVLANGHLSDDTKGNIVASLRRLENIDTMVIPYYAAFLIMIHPDYVIMK